jgi:MHS family proline/betaine transporter-like MFS transporter
VPFLIGVPLAFVGLYLRLRIEETPDFRAAAEAQELTSVPLKEVFVTYPRSILTALGLGLAVTISTQYLIAYIPSQLREVETLSVSELLITNVIALVAYTGVMPFVAMLSDRIGRRPVLLTVAIGFVTLTYPIFMLLSAQTLSSILAAQVLLATLAGSGLALLPATLAELFPTRVRYSGVGIGYSFPVAIFGGVTPFMATLLVSVTGNNLAPSFYLIAGALGTLIVVYFMRESYRVTFHRGSEDPAIRRTSDATLVEKE